MTLEEMKIMLLNSFTMTLAFSGLESSLKVLLLLLSIVYTGQRIYENHAKKNK